MTADIHSPATAILHAMLNAANISAAAAEHEEMLSMYAIFKSGLDALYELPEARDELPAVAFRAHPTLAVWPA